MHWSVRRKAKIKAAEHKNHLIEFLPSFLSYASSLFVYLLDLQMNLVNDRTCKGWVCISPPKKVVNIEEKEMPRIR